MKKMLSVVLAVAMSMGLSSAAFADTITKDGKGADIPLYATVSEGQALISVVMPVSIDYQISTVQKNIGTTQRPEYINEFVSLVSAEGEFKNNSTCNIDLDITKIQSEDAATDVPFINVVSLALGQSGQDAADVLTDENIFTDAITGAAGAPVIALGTLYSNEAQKFAVYGKDNADDTTSLADGKYRVTATIRVTAKEIAATE